MKNFIKYLFFQFAILSLAVTAVYSQQVTKPFYLLIDGGVGYARNISPGVPPTSSSGADYTNGGITGLFRIRGSKSDFITIGLESGWQHISSVSQQNAQAAGFGSTNITGSLNAIPIMGVVTIQDYNIQLHGSFGFYRLISTITVFGSTVTSAVWDMAFCIAAGYEIAVFGDYKIIPEFSWTRINDEQKSFLSLMIHFELPKWDPF